jgi:2-amino-4-hydroxy-6-hydroxymethyldihydropteridine diphosphokinase
LKAYLGLGSNSGGSRALMKRVLDELEQRGVHVVKASSLYETEPVGGPPGQPWFLNQVVEVEIDGSVRVLFGITQRIEKVLGRDRTKEIRWGPRPIDIDILMAEETIDDPDLKVPHPRMTQRHFVLEPLAEIAPEVSVPGAGSAREAAALVAGTAKVERR